MEEFFQEDLAVVLKSYEGRFGPAETKVAAYILENQEDAAFLGITRLASAAGVGEATLSRFVRRLGFLRFVDFQVFLQRRIRERLTPRQKTDATLRREKGKALRLAETLRRDLDHLERSLPTLDEESFQSAAKALAKARRVYLAGLGVSYSLCTFLAFRLRRAGLWVEIAAEQGGLERLVDMGPGDAAMAIGFFRVYPETIMFLEWANDRHAATIAVTENPATPLGRRASIVLAAPRGPISQLNSLVLPMAVANALAIRVTQLRSSRASRVLENLERLRGFYHAALDGESRTGGSRNEKEEGLPGKLG